MSICCYATKNKAKMIQGLWDIPTGKCYPPSQSNETYGFDANGNQNTTGFTTGTNNQTTSGLGFTYTFDDEGNRTSKTETATGKVE